jgi:predicted transcriptional regulator YdeE
MGFVTINKIYEVKLVSKFDKQLSELSTFETEEQDFVMFEHHGNPEKIGETIQEAFQWIQQSKYELNGNFNLEMYDSRCNPEKRENYIVELYFPVK